MAQGTVKFFNAQKGFGFIVQDGGGPDIFVHISAVERAGMRTLVEGQKLSFDVEADRRSGKSAAANLQSAYDLICSHRRLIGAGVFISTTVPIRPAGLDPGWPRCSETT